MSSTSLVRPADIVSSLSKSQEDRIVVITINKLYAVDPWLFPPNKLCFVDAVEYVETIEEANSLVGVLGQCSGKCD